MATNDNENQSTGINETLKADALLHVFGFMKRDELIKCKQVCTMWEELIDKYVGLKVYVGNSNTDIWEIEDNQTEWNEITVFQEHSIRECYMSFNPAQSAGEILQILNPNMLKKLWIDGVPPRPQLQHIFDQCKNITDLSFHAFTTIFDLTFELPQLKRFTISMVGDFELSSAEKIGRHVNQLIIFFRRIGVLSTVLREIGLQVPLEARQEVLVAEILQFFIRHQNSLDVIKLQLEQGDFMDPPNEQIERFRDEARNIKPAPTEFKTNRLKQLYLHSKVYTRNHRSILPVLDFFAPTKPILEILHLSLGYRTFPETMILKNSTTLQVVELAVNTQNHNETINLTPFEDCHNLKVLKLMSQPIEDEDPDIEQPEPDLTNLYSIPIGIQTLDFINLRIRKEDGPQLFRLVNLKRLILSNITSRRNYGLIFEDAVDLIRKRELEELVLEKAVNLESMKSQRGGAGDNTSFSFTRKKENVIPEYQKAPDYLEFQIENDIFDEETQGEAEDEADDDFEEVVDEEGDEEEDNEEEENEEIIYEDF